MEKLRDKAPDSVWMLQAKAEAQESEKQYDLALASFESVLRLEPQRPGVHYRMGRVYLARFEQSHDSKDRDQAADQFRAELAIDPMNGNAAYELAQIQYDLGNLEQARQQFESLIERRPEFEQARVGLAGILIETQKPGEAAIQLKRAIELDPNDEVAWYRLARALRLTGDHEGQKKAIAEFQRLHALESSRLARAGNPLRSRRRHPPATGRHHSAMNPSLQAPPNELRTRTSRGNTHAAEDDRSTRMNSDRESDHLGRRTKPTDHAQLQQPNESPRGKGKNDPYLQT